MPTTTLPKDCAASELLARIGESPHLPTPPPVALRIIQQASQPECELEDIAQIILLDPGLCAQVLRVVNSALFGLPHPIGSIERALNFLGLKSVRSLVLSLSLPSLRGTTGSEERWRECWKASVAAAIVAREFAVQLRRPDPEDDLVAALLCDLGMLVLQQACPAAYAPVLAQPPDVLAYRQCELEEDRLGLTHAEVSAFVLERWRLPPEITETIRHHHRPAGITGRERSWVERCRLLYLAMRLAQLPIAVNSQPALVREVLQLACDQFGLGEGAFLGVLGSLHRKIDAFTSILQMDLGRVAHYPCLVANASVELVRLSVEPRPVLDDPGSPQPGSPQRQQGTPSLALRAAPVAALPNQPPDHEVLRWRRIVHQLRREATRDRLTGAFSRACFEESLHQAHRRARRRGTLLGLLVLDLDDFQGFNARRGQAFGDQALKAVAAALRRTVQPEAIVARWGADEFSIVIPEASADGLWTSSQRVRSAVAGLLVRHNGETATLSATVGAALAWPCRARHQVADLLAAAARALAAARAAGKDEIRVWTLLDDKDAARLEEFRRRQFGTFLLAQGTVTEAELAAARRPALPQRLGGRLARDLAWLTPRQLRRTLRDQRRQRRSFGEAAQSLGYLTKGQVQTLQALRQEPPERLAERLVEAGALTADQAAAAVSGYYEGLLGAAG